MNAFATLVDFEEVTPFHSGQRRSSGFDQRKRRNRLRAKIAYATTCLAGFLRGGRELDDAIDLVIDDPTFARHVLALREASRLAPPPRSVHLRLASRFATHARDTATAELLRQIGALALTVTEAADRARQGGTAFSFQTSTPESDRKKHLLWFLADAMIPASVSRSLLGIQRWDVAMAAMRGFFDGGSLWDSPPAQLDALARVALDGLTQYSHLHLAPPAATHPDVLAALDEISSTAP